MQPIKNCYDPQTQAAFDLVSDMLTSHELTVSDKSGRKLTHIEVGTLMLESANKRAGGPLNAEQIATVMSMREIAEGLTGKQLAKMFCHTKLPKSYSMRNALFFDPHYPREKTYKLAIDLFTKGRDPKRQKEWMETFDPEILFMTTGSIFKPTVGKEETIKDIEEKYKKSGKLEFDIFPLVLTIGNMSLTFVNNKTESGLSFVLSEIDFFRTSGPDEGKTLCVIDTFDAVSSGLAIGGSKLHELKEKIEGSVSSLSSAVSSTLGLK